MVEPNPWMRCAQRVSELGLAGSAGPSADLLVDALRVLLWLCSERAPVPHSVAVGPGRSVVFGWRQGAAVVEVESLAPGRAVWRAANGDDTPQTGRLDARAAQQLRSLIPFATPPNGSAVPAAPSAGETRNGQADRGRRAARKNRD